MNSSSTPVSLSGMREYFEGGITRDLKFRIEQLRKLKQAIHDNEEALHKALFDDLKKSPEESWVTETGMVLAEINSAIKQLPRWADDESVSTNLVNLPSASRIIKEPLGVVLIIGPWNYPFQLLINPLVGAIAAGNCAVLKPSEFAPATSAITKQMIESTFPQEYIAFVEGDGASVIPSMMKEFRFDHVFYTGSTAVGKIIYKMAAENLVPVTLELGGKSPCIVESDANIAVAARRIAITKFSNAGQMCVAPDYILVHEDKKQALLNALATSIKEFFGERPEESYSYGKIINTKQFDRIVSYTRQGKLFSGGRHDREKLFIEPTIITDVAADSPIMSEEIFGPVLPVLGFREAAEAKEIIRKNPEPLAFYVFTSSKRRENEWLRSVQFGGGCINNASWHLTNHNLPFGGRGPSGIGNYHGRHSFETFTHRKAVMKTPTWFDPKIKYPPYKGKMKIFKWVIK